LAKLLPQFIGFKKSQIPSEPCRDVPRPFFQDSAVPLGTINLKGKKMSSKSTPRSTSSTPMTASAAARIQSATAKSNGGAVSKGIFAARAQSTVAKSGKR